MSRLCSMSVWSLVLLATCLVATPVGAGNVFSLLKHHGQQHPPYWEGNPQRHVAAPPGPHRYAEYNVYGPWYGYGFGVPTYQWGYFGARYRPAAICHKGYYGDLTQWGYRWGY